MFVLPVSAAVRTVRFTAKDTEFGWVHPPSLLDRDLNADRQTDVIFLLIV